MRGRGFPEPPARFFVAWSPVKRAISAEIDLGDRGVRGCQNSEVTGGIGESCILSRQRGWTPICAARADAHRVQRRTAGLVPNWLNDPAQTTLHLAGTPPPGRRGDTADRSAWLARGSGSDRLCLPTTP